MHRSYVSTLFPYTTLFRSVYPHMKEQGWGRIVNVGSSAGLVGFKGQGAHPANNDSTRGLTRVAARERAGDGIVVNVYCPVSMGHHMVEYEPGDGGYIDLSM